MKKNKSILPITLQKLNRYNRNGIKKQKNIITVNKMNSDMVTPEKFYKPISKIINLTNLI